MPHRNIYFAPVLRFTNLVFKISPLRAKKILGNVAKGPSFVNYSTSLDYHILQPILILHPGSNSTKCVPRVFLVWFGRASCSFRDARSIYQSKVLFVASFEMTVLSNGSYAYFSILVPLVGAYRPLRLKLYVDDGPYERC